MSAISEPDVSGLSREAEVGVARSDADGSCDPERVEAEPRQSGERLALALAATSEAVWEWNVASGAIEYCPRSLGYATDRKCRDVASLRRLIHPEDLPGMQRALQAHLEGRTPGYEAEFRLRDPRGDWRWSLHRGRVVERDSEGRPLRVVGVDIDINARKRSEAELRQRQNQLRTLATRASLAEEDERRRIAADLHDGLGQTLALARLELGALRKRLAAGELAECSEEIAALLDEAIAETRSLSFELASPILHELGLEAALRSLGRQLAESAGLRIEFSADPALLDVPQDLRVVLYRAVRELLINVGKHARARHVELRVSTPGHRIQITVVDDGDGFAAPPDEVRFGPDGGLGLLTVRESLAHVGGSAAIESAPGRGTRATLSVPLAPAAGEGA